MSTPADDALAELTARVLALPPLTSDQLDQLAELLADVRMHPDVHPDEPQADRQAATETTPALDVHLGEVMQGRRMAIIWFAGERWQGELVRVLD